MLPRGDQWLRGGGHVTPLETPVLQESGERNTSCVGRHRMCYGEPDDRAIRRTILILGPVVGQWEVAFLILVVGCIECLGDKRQICI